MTKIYAAEIINVLDHIHNNNVMHRDLKPENILITEDYHLKVVSYPPLTSKFNKDILCRLILEMQYTLMKKTMTTK